ncbi:MULTISPECIES: sodium-dependent bicarbonate transport family permease [Prochlorococcus]|uniref:Predicted permease n=1 Tax=Prochlorococcus marinus (strain SARG / CCMP1375 / SS120) TaxID=167539 RepID=Q7VDX4_PROMA|nr:MULTISPECIES: sodium-dependent bicarbonate transport family permease [Prochlorococcus]AAP99287.1 Predicted permease [Prochlorococcus marinus subsp. marinus str. CCMP1375]KGG11441.1 putative sodium-dependent bicarbonate transporter [Prochlorococcus marinus str. LG]KGG18603.1 putative sodium-dependent bicarbonate transporter [Prochlorococcus marinus str. SS2]KGG22876.1 putative sodium-dependent bicarbonate transporter [Prochlorococcus marinus str. SS35]KGG32752.1 putative sodium-dependent bic
MEANLVLQNVLTPPVLFFFLGIVAVVLRSDLEIPAPLPKLFSLYLLLAIGFKGGMELEKSGFGGQVLPTVCSAIAMSLLIPLICFGILRLKLDVFNSAAIAAAYGSISAVTFITAESFLESQNIHFDGFMVAALALMESPAIIVGLLLVKIAGTKNRPDSREMKWSTIIRESLLNGSVYLLLGSLLIGFLTAAHNPIGVEKMQPFTGKLFYGAECFFLLDMGIVAAQRLPGLKKAGSFLIFFAVLIPLFNAFLGVFVAKALMLGPGNALLFAVLCASASYLAVPAAMRMTVPEAKASYYISTTLGLTFPFNIVIGIPLYMGLVNNIIPSAG